MSYDDVGKSAKRSGVMRVNHVRKLTPVPERATPAAKPHRKVEKPFGFSYEGWSWWRRFKGDAPFWVRCYSWFKTAAARDQAMRSFKHRFMKDEKYRRDLRAERRDERTT